ncbi:MAG TPA: hypothetical protein PLS71_21860 [Leptospiraceae bacterium]|nr:hypothetical protein [Leptospiraceae bacterium]HNC00906.1 hypothetical protein [Leptospiraceae bacterium]HNH01633.1 hypothetical protein [Leptospiraceae bacterium]HNI90466.1 hypothetical protein [Leptospiraceae bacterium]HNK56784.1 hypothetical protein [Leptospiraceae bacterium]
MALSGSSQSGGVLNDTTTYSISGNISGLTSEGLVIVNNTESLTVSANAQLFQFSQKLKKGDLYKVEIKSYPSSPPQSCLLVNASGTVQSADISNIEINCSTGYLVSGVVSGLNSSLVLQLNGGSDLTVMANGSFSPFASPLANLMNYSVTVKTHPTGQVCYVSKGEGAITSSNVSNIEVQCTNGNLPPGPLVGGSIVKELIPQYGNDNPSLGSPFVGGIGVANAIDGASTSARFSGPYQITTDGVYIYVSDRDNNRIRRVRTSDGFVDTFVNDGNNMISQPTGITTDGVDVYVATQSKCQIVKIKISTGAISIIGGGAAYTCAIFNLPLAMTIDTNNLYITSFGNNKVMRLDLSNNSISTIVGTGVSGNTDNSIGTIATINGPRGIIKVGNYLFISTGGHNIRKVDLTTGTYSTSTLAGSTTGVNGAIDGIGTSSRFFSPFAISSDGTNLYVADSGNKTIRKIVISSGLVTTLAGCDSDPAGTTIGSGNPSISCAGAARYREPSGLTSDGFYLYVSDHLDHIIRRVE